MSVAVEAAVAVSAPAPAERKPRRKGWFLPVFTGVVIVYLFLPIA